MARAASMLVALLMVAGAATTARAEDDERVVLFPLEPIGLTPSQSSLPDVLGQAIAERLDIALDKPLLSDIALMFNCNPAMVPCLDQVVSTVEATTIVYGTVTWSNITQALTVQLRSFTDKSHRETHDFVLTAKKPAELRAELLEQAEDFLDEVAAGVHAGWQPIEDAPRPKPEVQRPVIETPPPPPARGITPTTYAILAGSGVVIATGIGFYAAAYGQAQAAVEYPIVYPEDAVYVSQLEQRRDTYWTVSRVLLAGGAVLGAYGVIRAVGEHETERSVGVTPLPGGAAVTLSGSFF